MNVESVLALLPRSGRIAVEAQLALRPGAVLPASVASVGENGQIVLRLGEHLIPARSAVPVQAGERLLLQVEEGADEIVLRRIETAPAGATVFAGARLSVPARALAEAVASLDPPDAPAPPLRTTTAVLPRELAPLAATPLPARTTETGITVNGIQVSLPRPLPLPPGTAVQATVLPLASGGAEIVVDPAPALPHPGARPGVPAAPAAATAPSQPAPLSSPRAAGSAGASASASSNAAAPPPVPLAPGASFPAIVVSGERGAWLQVGGQMLPAKPAAEMPQATAPVDARVAAVRGGRAELVLGDQRAALPGPATQVAQPASHAPGAQALAHALAPHVGAAAPAAAAILAARGAKPEEATKLAAKILAGQSSPVELMRELAAVLPQFALQVEAIEQDATAGSGRRLRQALQRITLEQEAAAVRGGEPSGESEAAAAPARAAALVNAQQLLLSQPASDASAPAYLFLPLPEQGELKMAIERSREALHVRGELELARLGALGFHLAATEAGVYLQIDSADARAVAHLNASAKLLREAVEQAAGKPTALAVVHRPPQPVMPRLVSPLPEERYV